MSDRQPYVPPTVTRVVLQPTQAVLSVCSGVSDSPADGGIVGCNTGNMAIGDTGCKKFGADSRNNDSAAQS